MAVTLKPITKSQAQAELKRRALPKSERSAKAREVASANGAIYYTKSDLMAKIEAKTVKATPKTKRKATRKPVTKLSELAKAQRKAKREANKALHKGGVTAMFKAYSSTMKSAKAVA